VKAREAFEAESAGTHTKAEYARVMDGFRAIYHAAPGDAHAARAVEQVAELLAEQGHELADTKSLKDAAGQYEFLGKAYPSYARAAAGKRMALVDEVTRVQGPEPKVQAQGPRVQKAVEASAKSFATPGSENPDPGHPASVTGTAAVGEAVASVTGIRHWSTATYTRVAIDLAVEGGDEVRYQAARVEHPDRIFFDLHHAKLAPQLAGKSFAVTDDGFLTRIRAAQFSDDVTRVVLDVHEVGEYSAFLLPNPYRLIIDIHGKQDAGSRKPEVGSNVAIAEETAAPVVAPAPAPAPVERVVPQVERSEPVVSAGPVRSGAAEVSSLPPMPVTDGGAAFGLPVRMAVQGAAVATPRVVVPTKPTVAKPVPNSVTTASVGNGVEVAAVSDQPGKVEASAKPTSAPVVDRVQSAGPRVQSAADAEHYRKPVRVSISAPLVGPSGSGFALKQGSEVPEPGHSVSVAGSKVKAVPAEAAAPTADGQTSLVRALGLKIGRIVIDAGHGGHDSGTLGVGGIEEKDVVLDVALRLGKLLHDRLGSEIVYTRADDTFIPLETRTAIANKAQADLFISVHANSSADASARGVEVYYLNFTSDPEAMRVASRENAVSTQSVHELSDLVKKIALKDKIEESKELASDVDASLYGGLTKGNAGLKDRGVKKAPFVVLIGANMPSILAEISFVTNGQDAEQLGRPEYRERVAESLYGGVARYAAGINGGKTKMEVASRAGK
jgi:N-acetylmuramoyl-L-alanine amidase